MEDQASSPSNDLAPSPLLSLNSTGDTKEDGEERQLADGRRGEEVGEEPNHTTARRPVPLWIIQYSLVGNIEPGVPGVDGGQWSVVGRAYTPNHRYISWGGFGIDTSLHLCFTFISVSVYAVLCERVFCMYGDKNYKVRRRESLQWSNVFQLWNTFVKLKQR